VERYPSLINVRRERRYYAIRVELK